MSGFQPKAEGFDSPAARQDRGPFYRNVYRSGYIGLPWRSRKQAMWSSVEPPVYCLKITLKEKAMT